MTQKPENSHKKLITVLINLFGSKDLTQFPWHLQNKLSQSYTLKRHNQRIIGPNTMGVSEVRRCWIIKMSTCHDAVSHCTLSSEACPVCLYVPRFKGGYSRFELVLLFSLFLATFDGWLNTETLGSILQGSCENVSLPSLHAAELWMTVVDDEMT